MTASTTLPISVAGGLPRRPSRLHRAILDWYDANGRRLPFRDTSDPWAVLVSEVMAQQTQIGRVGPAWERFIGRFPTPAALAAATSADALRAWSGLGYNRRAVALRRSACLIVERHDGRVPDDLAALEALPGIGPYTARAVLALAFGRRVAPVDVNVRRVLTRLASPTAEQMPARRLQALADELAPARRPGDWSHAVMDLGATVCRPEVPRCDGCPARPSCAFGASAERRPSPIASSRTGAVSFDRTSRWLRGTIVRRLAEAADGEWTVIEAPIGGHDVRAVAAALRALKAEGLVETDREGRRARLSSSMVVAG
ncbi:MAG TPA: hypothetical protein VJZ72_11205 [Candidatus Limnocylindrales bacterium]|nr:hypothetical protein [Candidatus Limnocylindrales bacterium]